jgi:hypothetical protein
MSIKQYNDAGTFSTIKVTVAIDELKVALSIQAIGKNYCRGIRW